MSKTRLSLPEILVLDQKGETGIGVWVPVEDFETLVVSVDTANSANLTVKAVGSIAESVPDPTSAQSITNRYEYILMVDLQNAVPLDGDTGVVFTGSDGHRLFTVNVSGLKFITFYVTARSAGDVTVRLKPFE